MQRINNVTDKKGRPIVFTFLWLDETTKTLHEYLPTCPFCGGNHLHGHSKDGTGLRMSHCTGESGGLYRLVVFGEATDLMKRHIVKRRDWNRS